jgi:hypothetical protein
MNRLMLLMTGTMALIVLPAYAASDEPRSAWSLNEILSQGSRLLTDSITHGLAIVQNHVEFDSSTTGGPSNGEESTHLRLKLFPNGKSQPDDALSAEGTFRRSVDPSDRHFGFEFRLLPPKHSSDPKEYI